ncbi:MAG: Adaptive-response sensory-kinase SasA [Burkholderiaceae bacterium]|nr:Adaptive-response sensory-kinase SasA [Burkholderiaceae bacterium]
MDQTHALIALTLGHTVCLLALAALFVQLLRGPRWQRGARAMAVALCISAVWSVCGIAYAAQPSLEGWSAVRWFELMRGAAWPLFILALLHEGSAQKTRAGARSGFTWIISAALIATVAVGGLAVPGEPLGADRALSAARLGLLASLAQAVIGLMCIEQLLRNVAAGQHWGIRPLAVGLGAVFAFDLYLYSDALLLGRIDLVVWSAQAAVLAFSTPLLALATARNRKWSRSLAVSQRAVFHATVLMSAAAYLLGMAALGYLVRLFGGVWGPVLQIVLFVAALMVLGTVLTLGTFRAKLRVWIRKHFFARRYDYREEWLRFTQLLSVHDAAAGIHVRCIRALADLVEGTAGAIWVRRGESYRQISQWNAPVLGHAESANGSLASFLARTGWVVDLEQFRREPDRYQGLELPHWLVSSPAAWLVVPLSTADGLMGFVVLMAPRVAVDVDWEVLDLLKAAGCEVAVLLRQIEANDALSESEKFAAVNRLSTFMVHDLKNLVAQLSLMVKNAERHGENPDFQRDMLATLQHVVARMTQMVDQARLSTRPIQNPQVVDLSAIVRRVCEQGRKRRAGLDCSAPQPVFALGHVDRLEHVLAHVVQNAIDATDDDGSIRVSVQNDGSGAMIEVSDDGVGMSVEFVQQRLFKAFQTTKEAGMGIGIYESRQYVASLGGQLAIDSAQGVGTKVRIVLPAAESHDPQRALGAA